MASTISHAQTSTVDPQLFSQGLALYNENCAICHGENGDGKGPLASGFQPRPRDLTQAVFKLRTTKTGEFPTEADLAKTIRNGIQGSYGRSMPPFTDLTEAEIRALIEVIRAASGGPEFGTPVAIAPAPASVDLNRGKELYEELSCADCHGLNGDGAGPLADELKDMNGNQIRPADFRRGQFKGGNTPEDIWMRVYTGLDGSPMPSFARGNTADEIWAVVEYIQQFSGTN